MSYEDHPVSDWRSAMTAGSQLVDVREPDEVAAGTLPGALNIPLGELSSRLDELDRSHRVVLLCRSGRRSADAAKLLAASGFADVVNLEGGMIGLDD